MKIHYSLTFSESQKWYWDSQKHLNRTHPIQFYALLAALGLTACFVVSLFRRDPSFHIDTLFSGLFGGFMGIIVAPVTSWLRQRHITMTIGKQQMVITQSTGIINFPWSALNLLDEDAAFIIIGAKMSRLRAPYFIVPKRVFETNQEAQAFLNRARAYWEDTLGVEPLEAGIAWPPAPKAPAG